MKNILFTVLAISSLTIISCRQSEQEEIFSPEDQANLKVLIDSSNNAQARKKDSTNYNKDNEGDPIPPPRK